MKMKQLAIFTAALITTAALGFIAGISQSDPVVQESVTHVVSAPSAEVAGNELSEEAIETEPEPAPAPTENTETKKIGSVFDTLALATDFLQTEALYTLAGKANVSQLRAFLNEADLIGQPSERKAAASVLYLRYSELAPEDALAHFLTSSYSTENQILSMMFAGWAKYDLDAAIARANGLSASTHRQIANNAILRTYADRDPELLDEVAQQLNGQTHLSWQKAMAIANQASADPVAAMESALALDSHNARRQAIWRIAQIWAQTDGEQALQYADQIDNQQARSQFRSAVLSQMAQMDPEKALAIAERGLTYQEQQTIVHSAINSIAYKDPQRALAIARTLDGARDQEQAMQIIFMTWSNTDPRAAATALASIDQLSTRMRRQLGYSVAQEFARTAPQEALAWAEQFEGKRGEMWTAALTSIAENDPAQALDLVSTMPETVRKHEIMSRLLSTLADQEPLLALGYLEDMPPSQNKLQATQRIVQSWAREDPQSALDWSLSQPDHIQAKVLPSLVYSVVEVDLELAADTALLIEGQVRERWISAVLDRYNQSKPKEAIAWIRKFSQEPNYPQWVGSIAAALVGHDPRAGARVISQITDPQQYSVAQLNFAQAWASQDPKAASRWFAALPTEKRNSGVIESIVSNWSRFDPDAAERWVNRLKTSDEKDAGIQGLIRSGHLSLEETERLISRLSTRETRERALRDYVTNLAQYAPDEARQLLNGSNLSEEARSEVAALIEQYSSQVW